MKRFTFPLLSLLCVGLSLSLSACSKKNKAGGGGAKSIKIDGSSTVFPISEAVAEEFQNSKRGQVRVTVAASGTGGGFKKFCGGETQLTGASRPIRPVEVELCKKNGVEFIELPVAFDGIAIVLHPENTWAGEITVADLKKMWQPEAQAKIKKWSDVRPDWPDQNLRLFGPGVDSGTYDYFTKAIVGKEHSSRGDFNSSEDDNIIVQGVSTDKNALGFFGFAYYVENKDKLKLAGVDDGKADNGNGFIKPSLETISNNTYQPLSRPIFMYVSKKAAQEQHVKDLVHFYLNEGAKLSEEVGYIPLPPRAYKLAATRFDSGKIGSVFEGGGSKVGVSVEKLLEAK